MPALFVIDVAHPPRHPDTVERELTDAVAQVRKSSVYRILKIIHGHGSTGRGGSTKDIARNWAFRNRQRMKAIIDGERYSVFNGDVQEMRRDVGQYHDADLERANPGITVVWVK